MMQTIKNLVSIEKKDFIGFLTIHYPEKRNALTPELLMELCINLETFSKNDDIRCVVIRGSGDKAFSSGYDIAAIPVDKQPDNRQETPDVLLRTLEAIKNFPYPTIAMLNGYAFGAGFNLCACCDIRIAADGIRMGMTPVRLGVASIFPPFYYKTLDRMTPVRLGVAYHPEGIQQFIEAFGIARTKEIFYTANIFQGKDLLRKGLVDFIVPKLDLENFTYTYAKKITQNAPLSLKGIKNIIGMFEKNMALNQFDLDRADKLMQRCFQSDDLKEGQAAFLEKRIPKFTGR